MRSTSERSSVSRAFRSTAARVGVRSSARASSRRVSSPVCSPARRISSIRARDEASVGVRDPDAPGRTAEIVSLLDELRACSVSRVLDAAEAYRGGRAEAAEAVTELIDVSGAWLRERVTERVVRGERAAVRELDAFKSLLQLRRDLVRRNANPQMVAERLLFGLRDTVA